MQNPPDEPGSVPSYKEMTTSATHGSRPTDVMNEHYNHNFDAPSKEMVGNSNHIARSSKTALKPTRKKYVLRSLTRSDRVLRSRSQEKTKDLGSNDNPTNLGSGVERKRKMKKKRNANSSGTDEYSKIRNHLAYLLHRMNYEQSLITAYSTEGWKGLSLEKLKPEKELRRATSEILKRKLKIRDLFKRVDSLCQEGRLPAASFDSEGQISSEDIFCAICGSKDITATNDIILCDGVCDRGFHQFCLVPPMLKEDIPLDDWLCPGCDCKADCIGMLNDSQWTSISITDSWEKVFPEAAAAAVTGQDLDYNLGLPSDDSDDNEYDANGPEVDEKSHGDESSFNESDSISASDKLSIPPGYKQNLGLPSDDSEDDDFNPDAADVDETVRSESSSSDFSSDSEDLAAIIDNDFSGENERIGKDWPQRNPNRQRSERYGCEKQSLDDELLSLSEQIPLQEGPGSISGRRNVERLDYKKLYDETYGNDPADSDDDDDEEDEDYNAIDAEDIKQDLKEPERIPKRRTRQKLNTKSTIQPINEHECSHPCSSSGKKANSRRYEEATIKRLKESFRENQYPDLRTKEALAKELGLTVLQVNRWFNNTRWWFNHPSSGGANLVNRTSEASLVPKSKILHDGPCENNDKAATRIEALSDQSAQATATASANESSAGHTSDSKLDVVLACPSKGWDAAGNHRLKNKENGEPNPITPEPNGRKRHQDGHASDPGSNTEEKSGKTPDGTVKETLSGGRITRQKKSSS